MTAGMPRGARLWIDGAWLRPLAACMLLLPPLARADPLLDAARWQHRLLVIAAPMDDDGLLRRQRDLLAGLEAEAASRDLVVVEIVGAVVDVRPAVLPPVDAGALRAALSLDGRQFGLVLVGLDGGVKRRSDQPLPACALLGAIDAMPMRRSALRDGGAIRCPD